MTWTMVLCSMLAAACVVLALVHFSIWLRSRAWYSLVFSVHCAGTAGLVTGEMWMMHSHTVQEFATAARWLQLPLWVVIVSLVAFVYLYFGTGRPWLGWTTIGVGTIALPLNFATGVTLNYLEITALRPVPFLGDEAMVAVGVPNPAMAVGQLAAWLCVAFVADASVTAWRQGARAKALCIGGAIVFFLVATLVLTVMRVWTDTDVPPTSCLFFLAIVAAMTFDMGHDVVRAQRLAFDLGESEQRMMLAANAANLGMWSRDLVRNETWANTQWRDLLGFQPGEALTQEGMIAKVHPEDRDRLRQVLAETSLRPGAHLIEFRVPLADGRVRWISTQGQAEFGSDGRPVRVRGASIDCTDRKQSEQEAVLLRQEIAHVGRVTVMGQLASALAHEINQPLGAILRNTEAAVMFLGEESPDLDEIRAILTDIHDDDRRAGAVIDRMRALLRRHEVDMRPLEVQDLFGDVATLLRPEAAARRIRLDLHIATDVRRVTGDRIHLQQVLLNLVSNGMDAIDEAGFERRRIIVTARHKGDEAVEISVRDSGCGIPEDRLGHLFEPFFTTKAKGMGMGLSISRTIIEAHGGRLWAENDHGGGARFLFTVRTPQEGA